MSRATSPAPVVLGQVGTVRLVAAGVAMVAIGYGFARYGYGLLLPDLRRDLGLGSAVLGLIGSGSYVAYLLATVAAGSLSARWGPRRTVVAGGACAAVGMAGIAVSTGPVTLGVGVLVAGMSSALVWPPFVDAVEHLVRPGSRARAHGTINSGTSYGVAVSAPLALLIGAQWRWAWGVFAACAVLATVWAAATLPAGRLGAGTPLPRLRFSWFLCPRSGPLLAATFLIGLSAGPFWTFAVDYVVRQEVLSASGGRLFYAAVGLAGFAGAVAGDLVTRYPLRVVFAGLAGAIAASFVLLAFAAGAVSVGIAGLLFGAAYIAIVGVITIWSTEVFADRPSAGLSASMFVMGVGLLTGPALAGVAATYVGMPVVLLVAAAVVTVAGFLASGTTLTAQRTAASTGT